MVAVPGNTDGRGMGAGGGTGIGVGNGAGACMGIGLGIATKPRLNIVVSMGLSCNNWDSPLSSLKE